MPNVYLSKLKKLGTLLNDAFDQLLEMCRESHKKLGKLAKQKVDLAIGSSLSDSSDKTKIWHELHAGNGNSRTRAFTSYLEEGHRIRSPSGITNLPKTLLKQKQLV